MMNNSFRIASLLLAFIAAGSMANAQLPNEKFGKPSSMEWEFVGWGDAIRSDAIILCKTMKVTYELNDQVLNFNQSFSDISAGNLTDFGKNEIDKSNIVVRYEFGLRTKILNPRGVQHANIDITYYNTDDNKSDRNDALSDLKIKVFSKNAKGKVEKRTIETGSFVRERLDDNYVVLHVVVPDVQPGSIIEYQYNITSIRPTFLYDWVFQECIPTVHTKCDIEIPAILQFNMNVPINKLIHSSVEAGRLSYDNNRPDLKKGKSCPTNHYIITGDYIRPEDAVIANFTSKILTPNVTLPAYMPDGITHLKIK